MDYGKDHGENDHDKNVVELLILNIRFRKSFKFQSKILFKHLEKNQ